MNVVPGISAALLVGLTLLFAQEQDSAVSKEPLADDTAAQSAPVEPPQQQQAPAATFLKLSLFAPKQFDSLLNLLPNGDSIRQNAQVVGIGEDRTTGNLVIILLNSQGEPQKLTAASFSQKPALTDQRGSPSAAPRVQKLEQNGRTWFIIETTLKSLFTYPSSYGTIFDQGDNTKGQVIAGVSLLTIGGMLYGSYAFTKNMELGYGKVALMNYGSTAIGNYYPTFLSIFLDNATDINEQRWYQREVRDSFGFYQYEERPKITDYIRAGTSVLSFPLGAWLGSRLNIADKDDYGKVALMTYFSQTLAAFSFALPVFMYDDPLDRDNDAYLSASTGLAMCMLPAGFYTGYWLGRGKVVSAGRGTLPWVTGTMGALTGLGLSLLGDEYHGIASTRAILAATTAGYAGGTWLGLNYHPLIDYTFWQSVFIGASAAAGAFISESLPLMFQANNHRAYILAAIAGGWAGFYFGEKLSLQLFEKSGRDKKASTLRLELPGLAALPLLLAPSKTTTGKQTGFSAVSAMPMADLVWRF